MSDRMEAMKAVQFQSATHACPSCEGPAYCAMEDGKSSSLCWCMFESVEYNPELDWGKCMCKTCLTKR